MININELTQQQINDGLIKVKAAIVAEPKNFDMHNYIAALNGDSLVSVKHFCDTAMCITGYLALTLLSEEATPKQVQSFAESLAEYNELTDDVNTLYPLAFPERDYDQETGEPITPDFYKATPQQACQAIDNYIAGNYQNPWDGVE